MSKGPFRGILARWHLLSKIKFLKVSMILKLWRLKVKYDTSNCNQIESIVGKTGD